MTRRNFGAIVSILAAAAMTTTFAAQTPPREAVERLSRARAAIGSSKDVVAIRSVRLRTQERDRMGTRPEYRTATTEARFSESRSEIRVLLPDHFQVATELLTPVAMSMTPWGFAGTGPASDIARSTFGYLLLALLLKTDTVVPFTLQGLEGDTLVFSGPEGPVFVDLDRETQLPRGVRYESIVDGTGERRSTRIELGEFATIERVRIPRSWKVYRGDLLLQDRRFETIEINPALTPADF